MVFQTGRVPTADFSFPIQAGGDGLLGADFLSHFEIDLDLQSERIRHLRPMHDCSRRAVFPHNVLYVTQLAVPSLADLPQNAPCTEKLYYVLGHISNASPVVTVMFWANSVQAAPDTGAPLNVTLPSGMKRSNRVCHGLAHAPKETKVFCFFFSKKKPFLPLVTCSIAGIRIHPASSQNKANHRRSK